MTARTLAELVDVWVADVGEDALAAAEARRVEAQRDARRQAEDARYTPTLCAELNAIGRRPVVAEPRRAPIFPDLGPAGVARHAEAEPRARRWRDKLRRRARVQPRRRVLVPRRGG